MQNNPSQEIRTDYKLNDVFKPVNANQLAKAIHYDYVITQDMFDNFIKNHGYTTKTNIDVGDIIASNIDGSFGGFETVKAPCSIFIAANTDGWPLSFTGILLGVGNTHIIDTTPYLEGGMYSYGKTRDMLNVYSQYPYKVSEVAGGINFWSTSVAPVILEDTFCDWNGVCKIGCAILNTPFDLGSREGLQFVFGTVVGNYRPTQSPTTTQINSGTYKPAVVFANWMDGSSVTTEYEINSSERTILGLYQSIKETISSYKCTPIIKSITQSGPNLYYFTSGDDSAVKFINSEIGKILVVYKDGSLSVDNVPGSGGVQAGAKTTISDFSLLPYTTSGGADGITYRYENKVSLLRPGYSSFLDITANWFSETEPFKFENTVTLDWYTWHAIYSTDIIDSGWFYNNRRVLYIDSESLVEGVVYEIYSHIMELPITYSPQAAPTWTGTSPAELDSSIFPYVSFKGIEYTRYWGSTRNPYGNLKTTRFTWSYISSKPETPSSPTASVANTAFSELAVGTVRFVKLDGFIYIMNY